MLLCSALALSVRRVGTKDLFFIDDREIDFSEIIASSLPDAPRESSLSAHWPAVPAQSSPLVGLFSWLTRRRRTRPRRSPAIRCAICLSSILRQREPRAALVPPLRPGTSPRAALPRPLWLASRKCTDRAPCSSPPWPNCERRSTLNSQLRSQQRPRSRRAAGGRACPAHAARLRGLSQHPFDDAQTR